MLELAVELRRQRLVRREDQRRPLRARDHLRHGEGLARAGDAEQHLVLLAAFEARHQFGDGGGLVAGGLVIRNELERAPALKLLPGALGPVRGPDRGGGVEDGGRFSDAGRLGTRHERKIGRAAGMRQRRGGASVHQNAVA